MGASIEQILNTYPGIKDDTDLTIYIELAKTQTSSCFYGSRYNQAVALRAAHNLVMSKPDTYRDKMSGGVLSKKQRAIQIQYGRSAGNNDEDLTGLSQTVYGQQLLGLMRMSNTTMGAIGMGTLCGGS